MKKTQSKWCEGSWEEPRAWVGNERMGWHGSGPWEEGVDEEYSPNANIFPSFFYSSFLKRIRLRVSSRYILKSRISSRLVTFRQLMNMTEYHLGLLKGYVAAHQTMRYLDGPGITNFVE